MAEQGILLGETIYRRLLAWLHESALPADTRLPGENELARRFAVSRPVLRQALTRLRLEGRLYARKGSGTYVGVQVDAAPRFEALADLPDMRRLLEFRCSLEREAAAYAALRRSAAELAAIHAAARALDFALAAGQSGIEEDLALHAAIAGASGNRFFIATLAALAEHTRSSIRLTRELNTRPVADRIHDIRAEHALICTAIDTGDPQAAQDAMTAHLRGGVERLFGRWAQE